MTLLAKTVIFDISVYMDFDWFLIKFWGYLGPQTLPKINKKKVKKQVNFDINCYLIFDGFWRGLGGQDGSKVHEKSIKKRYQKNDRKMSLKKSCRVMQGHARSRRKGGLAPLNQSIHPTKTAAVGPLSLHFVPQGHGGGYIYIYSYIIFLFLYSLGGLV